MTTDEDPDIARLRASLEDRGNEPPHDVYELCVKLLAAYDENVDAYRAWRECGKKMHAALLEIWHRAEPGDTKHMTFGLDPAVVVESVAALLAAYDSLLRSVDVEAEKKAQQYHASECVWKRRAEEAERKIDAALTIASEYPDPHLAIRPGASSRDSARYAVAARFRATLTTTPEKPEATAIPVEVCGHLGCVFLPHSRINRHSWEIPHGKA